MVYTGSARVQGPEMGRIHPTLVRLESPPLSGTRQCLVMVRLVPQTWWLTTTEMYSFRFGSQKPEIKSSARPHSFPLKPLWENLVLSLLASGVGHSLACGCKTHLSASVLIHVAFSSSFCSGVFSSSVTYKDT